MKSKKTDNKVVKQHNAITSGYHDFTACQLDIIFMLLANINEKDDPYKRYNIRVKDIEVITGRKWNYQQVSDSTEDLLGRVYTILEPIGKKQVVLFSEVQYIDGSGSFDIVINPPAIPLFYDLKNNFTLLELKSVLGCKSKHAKRIYGLSSQWRGTGGHTYSLSEFKEILGLKDPNGKTPEQYTKISMLQKEVLDRAKTQINGNTDVTFDYKLKKVRGRAYDTIVLYSGYAKPEFKQLEIDFHQNPEELKKIANIMAYDISKDMAEKIVKKCYTEFVKVKNETIAAMTKGKVIDHKGKYIIGVLQKKGLIEKKK